MPRKVMAARAIFAAGLAAFVLLFSSHTPPARATAAPQVSPEVHARAQRNGHVRVIVHLRRPDAANLIARLTAGNQRTIRRFHSLPFVVLEVSPAALDALEALGADVVGIKEDKILKPVLADSVPLIQADQAWAAGYDGTGTMIAVLDSGVDSSHPFLAGKVVEEACYSSNIPGMSESFCPNGSSQQIGAGSGAPCPLADCLHGTHVAGIAAGFDATGVHTASGVAKGAQLMSIQVLSKIIDADSCGGTAPCLGGFASDIIAGLEHVYDVAQTGTYQIAAVNMSLGESLFEEPCDDQPYKPAIDNLRAIGIASVAAAGNDGYPWALIAPACVSSAISVGATTKQNQVAYFSNVAPFLSLFAPGDSIVSSVPGGGYQALSGTSMATPHVAGVWGILKQAVPGGSVDLFLNALRSTGLPITDDRYGLFGADTTVPMVQVYNALGTLVSLTAPQPSITSISPTSVWAGFGGFTLTVTGTGFIGRSVVQWNGVSRPTTFVNATTLTAAISAGDVSAIGSALVTVTTPAPGGGTTSTLTFGINPPPLLSISAPTVAPGDPATVTLVNGIGGSSDWLALAATSANDGTYVAWTSVGAGVTSRSWTVATPTTAGTYEFRLFVNNRRAATSPAVTVDPSFGPVPIVSSLSPASVTAGGPAFTLTVNGSKFLNRSVVTWNGSARQTTFVSATQLQASISAADIAAAGSALVGVLTSSPGGGASNALTMTVNSAPALSVSATSVVGGSNVTVTLTNGLGGSSDWLAFAATSAANTSYLQWVYVGSGVTTRTWTVAAPTTPGTYEFRLFLNGGYTRSATSPTVTVTSAGPPVLTVSSTSVTAGANITMTLTNGSGSSGDWLAFAATSAANTSFVQTTYVGTNITTRTWTVVAPSSPGTYEFRLFVNNGYTRVATSPTVTVTSAAPTPAISVSATSVVVGSPVVATLINSPGGSSDWLALAATNAPDTVYIAQTPVGTGVTTRTWSPTMPTTPGTYEFRLYLNGGYTRAATSPTVTVTSSSGPAISVSATSVAVGAPVTATLTNGPGGSSDWLALAATNAPDSSYVTWTSVGAGVTTRTWSPTMPTTPGTYEFRLYLNGGYTRAATSPPITVTSAAAPTLTVNTTSVAVGGSVTVTLTNGPGGSSDWLAFAATTAANTSYLQWVYVGSGVTTRTWTVTAPTTPGTYEFRLFLNGGYTRSATSPPVTVH
jgi:subtilisin family serine protease